MGSVTETEPTRGATLPDSLDAALGIQLDRLELVTVRGLSLVSAMGVVLGLVVAATMARALWLACAATSFVLLLWFVVLGRALSRGAVPRGLRAASAVVESALPWMFMVVIALRQGAVYALASWVPPMLFCCLIVAYAARLRPRSCLILGTVGAVAHLLAYFLVIHARLPSESMALLYTRPSMQVSRAFGLFASGVLGAIVARGMRGAIGRAESAVRETDLFGKYRLIRKIASGGMGIVFEALYCPEGGFERRVAVKRIHPHLAAAKRFVDAFRDEAELSARLAHPGIVQVLDFGRVGDSFFLAMEHVDGMTLNALMFRMTERRRKLSPAIVGHVLREILSALAYAHEGARGSDGRPLRVVHRDLCPPNVLVSRNGEVKLTDFGIARSLSDASASMTQSVSGHVGYMAPEQARAAAFDTRADLFPVGVIAWELLTLRPLFRRENEAASLLSLLSDEVMPVAVDRPDVDARWSPLIARALARDPDERFASASEMLTALDAIPDSRAANASDELARLVVELFEAKTAVEEPPDEVPTQVLAGEPATIRSPP
jgi:serine/threonine protein kinase